MMTSYLRGIIYILSIVKTVHCWTSLRGISSALIPHHHGKTRATQLQLKGSKSPSMNDIAVQPEAIGGGKNRREFLLSTIQKGAMATAATSVASTLTFNPLIVHADEADMVAPPPLPPPTPVEPPKPNFSQSEIAAFLRPIPTFAIVDPKGVPYMVVGEDAKLSAYFFTSYQEANRIVNVAKQSADKAIKNLIQETNDKRKMKGLKAMTKSEMEEEVGVNPWLDARISTVPLDFSVGLASRGKVAGSYFRIAPSENDISDALEVESSIKELSEGKVPLFYIDDFEIDIGGQQRIPLYFQKSQLLEAYKKSTKDKNEPVVKVTELFSILTQMAGTGAVDDDLKKLTLIPPKDSIEKAKLSVKKGGDESPYKIGERIVVL